jgi:4-amino-4-deoxy-L-arabinose transferase-like glycosyltransferase
MAQPRLTGLAILILLLGFGLRLHQLLALPLFIDETLHAQRAVDVWQGSPLWFGVHGKYLGAWWTALFYPFPPHPWLIRAAMLLLMPLGTAAVMSLTRRLYGPAAAVCAGLLLIFAPMLFFFDGMTLADTILQPMLALFVLLLFHLLDRTRFRRPIAVMTGAALALAVMAKASALAILPLPFIAVWILPRGWNVRDRVKAMLWVPGTALLIWLPLLVLMRARNINYLGVPLTNHSAEAGEILLVERLLSNIRFVLDGLLVYFGALPLLLALLAMIAAVLARPRRGLVLAMAFFGPALGIVLIGETGVSMRYWLGVMPLGVALAAGGLWVLARRLAGPRIAPLLLSVLVGVWVVTAALPFILTAYTNPPALNLPNKDALEYLQADSAGTMLPELAAYLAVENARAGGGLVVTGAISQCYGLSLLLAQSITLDCPRVFSPEGHGELLDAHVAALAAQHAHYYVIFEQLGIVPVTDIVSTTLETVTEFPRPGGLVTITVYRPRRDG